MTKEEAIIRKEMDLKTVLRIFKPISVVKLGLFLIIYLKTYRIIIFLTEPSEYFTIFRPFCGASKR